MEFELDYDTVVGDLNRIALAMAERTTDDNAQNNASDLLAIAAWLVLKRRDESMAVWYTPQAIREHFDASEGEIEKWVEAASDEELAAVGEEAISCERVWTDFHESLIEAVRARIHVENDSMRRHGYDRTEA